MPTPTQAQTREAAPMTALRVADIRATYAKQAGESHAANAVLYVCNAYASDRAEIKALRATIEDAKNRFSALALDAHASENTIRAIASKGAQFCREALAMEATA